MLCYVILYLPFYSLDNYFAHFNPGRPEMFGLLSRHPGLSLGQSARRPVPLL